MIISDKAVQNRTTVFFLTFLLIVGGFYAYVTLPRESTPDVQVPFVFVNTSYRGASPEDVEQLITIPIEDKLKGLSGVREIRSVSAQGQSMINIEFDTGRDINDALVRVKDKVDQAKVDLPNDLEDDPVVSEVNFSEMPILVISMAGDFGERQLGKLADDLKDEIEKVPGVLEVELSGKVKREIQVQVSLKKMIHYGIPFSYLSRTVSGENQNISAGSVERHEGDFQLRIPSQFTSVDEAEELILSSENRSPVYLRDVANVVDGLADRTSRSRLDGNASILLSVKKRAGANILDIVNEVKAILETNREQWPDGLAITVISDGGDDIRSMIEDLQNNILSGLLLVVLVVCVAMGLRNAIIVSLSIPLSMLLSFVILQMLGITLNMVVLFSLTLALGMLVDNAIVIVENIYRFMQQGVPRKEAAMRATAEVAWPIIGSAFTTIFAFLPLLWWDGIMGGFMVFLPQTVIITLVSCLFVAMVINPAIAAAVMKPAKRQGPAVDPEALDEHGEHPMLRGGSPLIRAYRHVLRFALSYRLAVVASMVFVVVLCFLFWFIRVGVRTPIQFFPAPDPDQTFVDLRMPQGVSLGYADRLVREATKRITDEHAAKGFEESLTVRYEDAIQPKTHTLAHRGTPYPSPSFLPDVELIFETSSIAPGGGGFFAGGESNRVTVKYVDLADRIVSSTITQARIEEAVRNLPGAEVFVVAPQGGPPTGAPITIEISGHDFVSLGVLAEQVKRYVNQVDFVRNVRSDYESGTPTFHLVIDRKRAAALGLDTNTIGNAVRSAFAGAKVSTYREGDEKFDIVVRFGDADRDHLDTLRQIFLPSTSHGIVPLTTVAKIEYTGGLGRITRVDHRRVVTVLADVDETQTTGDTAMNQARSFLLGSPVLRLSEIRDWPGFLQSLARALDAPPDTPAGHLASRLPNAIQTEIRRLAQTSESAEADRRHLLTHLNTALLDAPDLYDPAVFQGLEVSPEAAVLLAEPPELLTREMLQARNRALLTAAFPGTIGPSVMPPLTLPPGYAYAFKGQSREQEEAMEFLEFAMFVALLLITLVLVMQFNSILYPMVIMSSVVLSFGGVFLGLGICGLPFGLIMTGVGAISLAGVVVNNAIVLVDYTIQLRDRGLRLHEAIVAAGATRLRPVLLTAVTTILGLIPMAVGTSYDFINMEMQWQSESSQWWRPMAVAVIFGLMLATVLTLVVVPVLLSLSDSLATGLRRMISGWGWIGREIRFWWYGVYDRVQRGAPITPRMRAAYLREKAAAKPPAPPPL